jgi:hypothetical protein
VAVERVRERRRGPISVTSADHQVSAVKSPDCSATHESLKDRQLQRLAGREDLQGRLLVGRECGKPGSNSGLDIGCGWEAALPSPNAPHHLQFASRQPSLDRLTQEERIPVSEPPQFVDYRRVDL